MSTDGSQAKSGKRKKAWFRFSVVQKEYLLERFDQDPYPSRESMIEIGERLDVKFETIKNWFVKHRYDLRIGQGGRGRKVKKIEADVESNNSTAVDTESMVSWQDESFGPMSEGSSTPSSRLSSAGHSEIGSIIPMPQMPQTFPRHTMQQVFNRASFQPILPPHSAAPNLGRIVRPIPVEQRVLGQLNRRQQQYPQPWVSGSLNQPTPTLQLSLAQQRVLAQQQVLARQHGHIVGPYLPQRPAFPQQPNLFRTVGGGYPMQRQPILQQASPSTGQYPLQRPTMPQRPGLLDPIDGPYPTLRLTPSEQQFLPQHLDMSRSLEAMWGTSLPKP